jgi:hypothetical protein
MTIRMMDDKDDDKFILFREEPVPSVQILPTVVGFKRANFITAVVRVTLDLHISTFICWHSHIRYRYVNGS